MAVPSWTEKSHSGEVYTREGYTTPTNSDTKRYKMIQFEHISYVSIPLLFLGGDVARDIFDVCSATGEVILAQTKHPKPQQNTTILCYHIAYECL